jgi:hypothetical protein
MSNQIDRVWATALQNDDFTKHDITNQVEAGNRIVHNVLKKMVNMDLLVETTEHRYIEHDNSQEKQDVTVYSKTDAELNRLLKTAKNENLKVDPPADQELELRASGGETLETDKIDSRYMITCPECEWIDTRERNSEVIKMARQNRQGCSECGSSIELLKDDRPDPPMCPKCGEEVIRIDEQGDKTQYVHEIETSHAGRFPLPEVTACYES